MNPRCPALFAAVAVAAFALAGCSENGTGPDAGDDEGQVVVERDGERTGGVGSAIPTADLDKARADYAATADGEVVYETDTYYVVRGGDDDGVMVLAKVDEDGNPADVDLAEPEVSDKRFVILGGRSPYVGDDGRPVKITGDADVKDDFYEYHGL